MYAKNDFEPERNGNVRRWFSSATTMRILQTKSGAFYLPSQRSLSHCFPASEKYSALFPLKKRKKKKDGVYRMRLLLSSICECEIDAIVWRIHKTFEFAIYAVTSAQYSDITHVRFSTDFSQCRWFSFDLTHIDATTTTTMIITEHTHTHMENGLRKSTGDKEL